MASALDGIKILELSRVSPGAFCTMMLADMGAEVLKIETPPSLLPGASGVSATDERQAAFSYVNRNKRSLALNLKAPQGQKILHQLVATTDVLLEGFRPGVMQRLNADYDTLSRINPRLVYCSLSGFGQSGPYRDLPAHDLNYLSISGVLDLIGPNAEAPPAIPLNLIADYGGAAMHGMLGILLALHARHQSERGQHVDVSYLDSTISLLSATLLAQTFFTDGLVPQRGAGPYSGQYAFYTTYETKDGKLLSVGCTEPWLWRNLCNALDRPALAPFYRHEEHLKRPPNAEEVEVREQLQVIFRQRSRDQWVDFLRDKNVCIGAVHTVAEVFDDPQVQHRQMLVAHESATHGTVRQVGIGLKLSDTPGGVRHLGPYLGQHTADVLAELGYVQEDVARLREQAVVG
ncbi:MAG: CaiB/BaiF CoA-transferase family protein [bacterium]|nr:CaiB/BaiF CoA-transferase family protein [bacterium]